MSDKLTIGWRLLCHDCGSNYDLHACFIDCDHGENDGSEGECNNEAINLCGECIEKREE